MRKIKRRIKKLNRPDNSEGLKLCAKNLAMKKHVVIPRFRSLIKLCKKNPSLAIYLSYLVCKSDYFYEKTKDVWFFVLPEKLKKDLDYIKTLETKMGRTRFDKKLESLGYIETIRKGWNNRKYYKIQWQKINQDHALLYNEKITRVHSYIIYNNIYNSIDNKLKLRQNTNLPDGKLVQVASQPDTKDSRVITRRQDKYIDNTISHWSSLGTPFAKVTTSNIKPLLKKIIKTELDSKEVIKVIDKAFIHISNPDFKFKTKGNMSMKLFLVRGSYLTPATEFLRANKRNSWFTLFKLSNNTWLDANLHKIEIINSQEVFDFISDYFGTRNNKKEKLVRASNKMALWMKVNNYDLRTMSMDFDNFMHDKYPDIRDFEVYWLISDKFWNNQFAKYIVNFGRFKNIDEVKKI